MSNHEIARFVVVIRQGQVTLTPGYDGASGTIQFQSIDISMRNILYFF